jgi:hypothetical protein
MTEHFEPEHVSIASVVLHGVLHAPQWVALVVRSKHPAPGPPVAGQSVGGPMLQASPQLVPSHVELPFVGTGQDVHDVVPQEPVDVLRRHVAAAPAPQLWVPAGHAHWPLWHCIPFVQAWPQAPQFAWLLVRSRQERGAPPSPPQGDSPTLHWHTASRQTSGDWHLWPHAPQLLASVRMLTQTGGAPHNACIVGSGFAPQSSHTPPRQLAAVPHEVPQVPQSSPLVFRSTHCALAPLPQTFKPIGQTHPLFTQVAPMAHVCPHSPQLFGSLEV